MYIIKRGQVDVLLGADGAERRVNTLDVGDYFGEMALLAGEPRNATVRAAMPTELFGLAQEDFTELVESQPDVRAALDATLASRREALRALAPAQVG